MISSEDIKKLATLARIELTESEITKFSKDIGGILEYVATVKKVSNSADLTVSPTIRNVLRSDEVSGGGQYTEAILQNAPATSGDYIAVKKILEGKK